MDVVFFIVGLALLVAGAEALVRGASRLAGAVGIPPLIVGLTVVAFGTSSPEMAVSVQSALSGDLELALGNVVGSNIFNVLFILGICALVAPLAVAQQLIRFDVPIMIGVSALTILLAIDGEISRIDGVIFVAGLIAYTAFVIVKGRRESAAVEKEYEEAFAPPPGEEQPARVVIDLVLIAVGLGLLVGGSTLLVNAAENMAKSLGVSDLIIGLTIVAAGTSTPEVATSILATIRGERDIAVGNVVGSNIFNLLGVLGVSSIVASSGIPVPPAALRFDLVVMTAVALACLPLFFTGTRIGRWEGLLFLGYYPAYTLYLILDATDHDALPAFSATMLIFVMPLTLAAILVSVGRALNEGRRGGHDEAPA